MIMQVKDAPTRGVFARVFKTNRLMLALVAVHFAIAVILSALLGVPFSLSSLQPLLMFLATLVPVFLIILWVWHFGRLVLFIRPEKPIHRFIRDIRDLIFDPERILSGVVAMLAVSIFASTFTTVKILIPEMNPYSWDPLFATLDRTLHGGIDPYRLLMPILGTPYITTFMNIAYHFWFFLFYFIVSMACFDRKNTVRRNTLLLSFLLTWIIGGNLLATVFSSAGPPYYQIFGYGDTFVPLFDTLKEFSKISPVWVLEVQDKLLDGYYNDGPLKGISAMPSMHVAVAVMLAMYGFQYRRWAGWLLVIFAILIQIGSVQLGWHYAIDGYAGAIIAIISWKISSKLAERYS